VTDGQTDKWRQADRITTLKTALAFQRRAEKNICAVLLRSVKELSNRLYKKSLKFGVKLAGVVCGNQLTLYKISLYCECRLLHNDQPLRLSFTISVDISL